MWTILAITAALALIAFWHGPNAVWGGLTFGSIGGLVWAIAAVLFSTGFEWFTIAKGAIIGVLAGLAFEILGKMGDRMRSSDRPN